MAFGISLSAAVAATFKKIAQARFRGEQAEGPAPPPGFAHWLVPLGHSDSYLPAQAGRQASCVPVLAGTNSKFA